MGIVIENTVGHLSFNFYQYAMSGNFDEHCLGPSMCILGPRHCQKDTNEYII